MAAHANHESTTTSGAVVLPTGEQFIIEGPTDSGYAVATITEVGASLRALTVDGVDLVQRYPEGSPPSLGAGVVMAPWPNRVADGRWDYNGVAQQLSITDTEYGNSNHGLLMWTPYRVLDKSADAITLSATIFAHPGYPFVVATTVRYAVTSSGIETTHTFTTLGDKAAPVAVGSHAYYRIGDLATETLTLTSSAGTVYTNNDRLIPTGSRPVAGDFDLRSGQLVGDVVLDDCFTDLKPGPDSRYRSRLSAPDGRYVEVWGDESFDHVVLLTTRRFTDHHGDTILAVAIEPQTAAANALNTGIGIKWLAPGETWTARWGITFG
jgi:aldose 1-epimerase